MLCSVFEVAALRSEDSGVRSEDDVVVVLEDIADCFLKPSVIIQWGLVISLWIARTVQPLSVSQYRGRTTWRTANLQAPSQCDGSASVRALESSSWNFVYQNLSDCCLPPPVATK